MTPQKPSNSFRQFLSWHISDGLRSSTDTTRPYCFFINSAISFSLRLRTPNISHVRDNIQRFFESLSNCYQSSFRLIHNNSLPLGLVLTALLLVNAVVIDLMLTAIHILASLVKDVACVIEQVAYAYDDPCIQPLLDGT